MERKGRSVPELREDLCRTNSDESWVNTCFSQHNTDKDTCPMLH